MSNVFMRVGQFGIIIIMMIVASAYTPEDHTAEITSDFGGGLVSGDIEMGSNQILCTVSSPCIYLDDDEDTFIQCTADDNCWVYTNNVQRILFSNSGIKIAAGGIYNWTGRLELSSPDDAKFLWTSDDVSTNVCWDVTTDATAKLYDGDCSSGATLQLDGGSIFFQNSNYVIEQSSGIFVRSGPRFQVRQYIDNSTASTGLFIVDSLAAAEMTASSGTQYGASFQPEIEQSGTAAFYGLHVDVTDTASGSGQDYTAWLGWGSSLMFGVQDDGEIEVASYNTDYVIPAGSAILGPTSPTWIVNDSVGGLGFNAVGETVNLSYEVPNCYSGSGDLTLKAYLFFQSGDAPQDTEDIDFDISWRVIVWGTDDVDQGTAVTQTSTYTQSGAGDEDDTHVVSFTLDYDNGSQDIDAGDSLTIIFNRDTASESNSYSGEAGVHKWEIEVPQTKLRCDHN